MRRNGDILIICVLKGRLLLHLVASLMTVSLPSDTCPSARGHTAMANPCVSEAHRPMAMTSRVKDRTLGVTELSDETAEHPRVMTAASANPTVAAIRSAFARRCCDLSQGRIRDPRALYNGLNTNTVNVGRTAKGADVTHLEDEACSQTTPASSCCIVYAIMSARRRRPTSTRRAEVLFRGGSSRYF